MSTPRKIRRHADAQFDEKLLAQRAVDWTAGILDLDIAACLASIISEFEHIEESMVSVFAGLLGAQSSLPARVVYHTLRNPSIKLDVLRTLLESSPNNSGLGPEFDKLLVDYNTVRSDRNRLAHGLWWTDSAGLVYFAPHALNGEAMSNATEVTIKHMNQWLELQRAFKTELLEVHVVKLLKLLQAPETPNFSPTPRRRRRSGGSDKK
jgi:hypothetical protein